MVTDNPQCDKITFASKYMEKFLQHVLFTFFVNFYKKEGVFEWKKI